MVSRRTAALLLALALVVAIPGDAFAAIPTLKPTPPSPLPGPAPRPRVHHHAIPSVPATPTVTSSTVTTPTGSLPMTGTDLPLELGVAGVLLAAGLVARLTSIRMRGGSRSYKFKSGRDRAARR